MIADRKAVHRTSFCEIQGANMNLKDNQFLKVKILHRNWLDFEIFELPAEPWQRPKRHHLQVPLSHLVNRRKRESKIRFLFEQLRGLQAGAEDYIDTY
jgi:hypothetical protein